MRLCSSILALEAISRPKVREYAEYTLVLQSHSRTRVGLPCNIGTSVPPRLNSGMTDVSIMDEIVSMDSKGRLVLPKTIRAQARIDVNHELLVRATGIGRVELLDPDVLMAKARDVGSKKLSGWKEADHEAAAYLQRSMKKR